MRTASSLLEELRAVDESTAIEAKTASKIDRSAVETVCTLANEPGLGGGYLLLGVGTRNPHIAAVLHDVHLAETKGSGIRVMRELMQGNNLLPPAFESSRRPDQFVATFLFHHLLEESDVRWLGAMTPEKLSDEEARALVFVRELGALNNAVYREINRTDTLQSSAHLRRLRDLGILEMRGSGNRTYYVGTAILTSAAPGDRSIPADLTQSAADLPMPAAELTSTLPSELMGRLANLGRRPRVEVIQDLIVALCSFRPWSATDLGQLLGERDPRNLAKLHLRPLKEAGKLAYLIPEMPKHPQQKCVVPDKEQS